MSDTIRERAEFQGNYNLLLNDRLTQPRIEGACTAPDKGTCPQQTGHLEGIDEHVTLLR